MTRIFKSLCVFAMLGFSGNVVTVHAAQVALCHQKAKPNAPTIQKVTRSPRTDGVWHDIFVSYQGKTNQKLTLSAFWEAQTPAEDGKGTVSSKAQSVRTDKNGQGNWKMEVKGYPAGKMRANVRDEQGSVSELSPAFDVPWIF